MANDSTIIKTTERVVVGFIDEERGIAWVTGKPFRKAPERKPMSARWQHEFYNLFRGW